VKKSGMLELAGQDRGFQGDAKIIIIINQSITSIEQWTDSPQMSKQIKKNRVEGDWLFQSAVSAVKTRSGFTNGIQLTRVRWERQRQPHVGCTCDQSPR